MKSTITLELTSDSAIKIVEAEEQQSKSDTAKITITVSKDLHKKIKQKALDDDRGVLELVLEAVERAFK